jgi:uncharacterized protein (DUF934 family)
MATVIDLSAVVTDEWVRYDRYRSLGGATRILVSVVDLARYPRYFERSSLRLGLDLEVGDAIGEVSAWLPRFELIRLNFEAFSDGRPFSQARLLRERYAYRGDIRAHGQVLRDQLSFMQRCGINQFSLADGEDVDLALDAFQDISESYQPPLQQMALGRVANGQAAIDRL